MIRRLRLRPADRQGNVLVLTASMMVVMITLLAFAVDLGYINIARTELQRAADSAAMAATWELIDPTATTNVDLTAEISSARQVAASYAAKNKVTGGRADGRPEHVQQRQRGCGDRVYRQPERLRLAHGLYGYAHLQRGAGEGSQGGRA